MNYNKNNTSRKAKINIIRVHFEQDSLEISLLKKKQYPSHNTITFKKQRNAITKKFHSDGKIKTSYRRYHKGKIYWTNANINRKLNYHFLFLTYLSNSYFINSCFLFFHHKIKEKKIDKKKIFPIYSTPYSTAKFVNFGIRVRCQIEWTSYILFILISNVKFDNFNWKKFPNRLEHLLLPSFTTYEDNSRILGQYSQQIEYPFLTSIGALVCYNFNDISDIFTVQSGVGKMICICSTYIKAMQIDVYSRYSANIRVN